MSYIVYSKEDCVFCEKAKTLLTKHAIPFEEYVVPKHLTLRELKEQFPLARTVPIILKDGKMIGGYTELQAILT